MLRAAVGGAHPSRAGPRLRGRPSEAADGPLRAWQAFAGRVAPKTPQGPFLARLRAWEGPRRSGGLRVSLRSLPGRLPGLRCSSRRALRRSRFRCPLGFPFSLSPLLYLHSINRHPPVSSPESVSFATFPAIIRNRRLPNRKTKGSSFQLRTRNLPERNLRRRNRHLPACHLTNG